MLVSLIISADITDSYGFNVLAAQLKKLRDKNVKVQQFFIFYKFNELYPQSVISDLIKLCQGSDLIGISLISSAFRNSVQITEALRRKISCPIIWGGKHPTIDPESCIKYADIICLSEGEDTLLEVVSNMLLGKTNERVLGTWFKKEDGIIKNNLRPLEKNLDKYIFPDYSLEDKFILDKENYRLRPLELKDLKPMEIWYPTMMTRGCPNFCTFCTNSTDFRMRHMRYRSIGNVIREVKSFLTSHPDTKRIFFRDDCLSAMPLEFIREFSQRWKNEVGLPCSCSGVIATSEDFREKIRLLTAGGMTNFKMGIQSGCQRVRTKTFARINETDEIIIKATKDLHDLRQGKINYYMITDNPYENEDELIQSIRFTSGILRPFSLSLYSLNFYPGTALYNMAIRDNIIKDKNSTLLESTMDFKNVYLNKVFISLKFFEIPPFLINIMTNKKIYKNKIYQAIFNCFFKFLFKSETPSRLIKKPIKYIIGGNIFEILRWFAWEFLEKFFIFYHRKFVKQRYDS